MNLLRTEGLVKVYRGRRVVNEVNIQVEKGRIVGLLGPNGAGKTTTFHMVVGLITPTRGKVWMDGKEITRFPISQRARMGIGYLPQEPSVFQRLRVEENLMAILELFSLTEEERAHRLNNLLEELEIEHLRQKFAFTLSGGERRRVEIARTLATSPSFLLLDEPFTGIDPVAVEEIQEILKRLKKEGMGILITDHNVRETLSITDHAYLIHEGKVLLSGTSSQLIEDPQARKFYLGERFRL